MSSLAQLMQHLSATSNLPLYQQLQRALREAIDRGVYGPAEALPAERQLAAELDISRITVRKAIDGLVEEGLLVRRAGLGQFHQHPHRKEFRQADLVLRRHALARPHAAQRLAQAFGRNGDAGRGAAPAVCRRAPAVYRFNRIRYADDMPMCLEYATIAASALPSLDAVDVSMYEALEAAGKRPVRALQRLSALLLNAEQAKLLQSKEGDAGCAWSGWASCRMGRRWSFAAPISAAICMTWPISWPKP
jgi:GntR family transcriptional regulator